MIYLRCPLKTLVKRIRQRGRAFEKKIPRSYLASLERLYEAWYARYDLSPSLVVETDRCSVVARNRRGHRPSRCHGTAGSKQ